MPTVRAAVGTNQTELVFIDDNSGSPQMLNRQRVMNWINFTAKAAATKSAVIAIENSEVQEKLIAQYLAVGINLPLANASNVFVDDYVGVGASSILLPFVTPTANVRFGKRFHANIYSYVAHDSVVGDFVTLAFGVMCDGNVHNGSHDDIWTGAVLKQGAFEKQLVIGNGAVVGIGAAVAKSVSIGFTVVGISAINKDQHA